MVPIAKYVIVALVSLVIGAGATYRFCPKTVVVTKVVTKHEDRIVHRNVETTRRTELGPDGKPVTVTTKIDRSVDEAKRDSVFNSKTVTSRESPNWAIGGGLLQDLHSGKQNFYGQLERRLIWEVYGGVIVTNSGQVGIGLMGRF